MLSLHWQWPHLATINRISVDISMDLHLPQFNTSYWSDHFLWPLSKQKPQTSPTFGLSQRIFVDELYWTSSICKGNIVLSFWAAGCPLICYNVPIVLSGVFERNSIARPTPHLSLPSPLHAISFKWYPQNIPAGKYSSSNIQWIS